MTENEPHRESCRRQHRVIGNYLAMEAWTRGLDCIVLIRSDMESFLGLRRFKSTRVNWLKADLMPWFPYQEAYFKTGSPSSIHSLFLSRVPISRHLPSGTMTTDKRIAGIAKDAPKTKRFSTSSTKVPGEAKILSDLVLLASGLDIPAESKKKK